MDINDSEQYRLEMLAFNQKIALAELEASKAQERVRELNYEKTCYQMNWFVAMKRKAQAKN